ncbi:MAG: hypothetical protein MUF87_06090 [Anaerolineae bacterium]|jgi:hypothetical protein|nr:hypothetical protein [Anaerolineae bacterium]
MFFPTVSGETLTGQEFTVPFGLAGELNLLLVGFDPKHLKAIRSWLAVLPEIKPHYPGFHYYHLALGSQLTQDQQMLFGLGMRHLLPEAELRELSITVFLDKALFCEWLTLPSQNTNQLFLVDREGGILWRCEGFLTPPKREDLYRILTHLYSTKLPIWEI